MNISFLKPQNIQLKKQIKITFHKLDLFEYFKMMNKQNRIKLETLVKN